MQILRYRSRLLNLSWRAWDCVVVLLVCLHELHFDIQKRFPRAEVKDVFRMPSPNYVRGKEATKQMETTLV